MKSLNLAGVVAHLDPLVVDGLVGEDEVRLADGGGEGGLDLVGLLGHAGKLPPVDLEVRLQRRRGRIQIFIRPVCIPLN